METAPADRLEKRLSRWPRDRYPLMHAHLCHLLGRALMEAGDRDAALEHLRRAEDLYADLAAERGTVLNAIGSLLREAGDATEARDAFESARALLRQADRPTAAASASFNLGLVLAETGADADAETAFEEALAEFDPGHHPAEAAAVRRELGPLQARRGDTDRAISGLREAVELSAAGGDRVGLAAAANNLGLVLLADDRFEEAAEAFAESAAASPATVRPEAFSMSKANLALTYEAAGRAARAILAARQALAVPEPPEAVEQLARQVLGRLGTEADLHDILDSEPAETWAGILRDEVWRWITVGQPELGRQAAGWLTGFDHRADSATERLAALFDVALELPATDMEDLLAALAAAAGALPDEGTGFRERARRAAARFHLPQMQRLEAGIGVEDPRE